MNKKTRETNLIGIADIVAKQKKRMRKRKDNWSMNWGNPFPLLLTGFFFFFFLQKERWIEMNGDVIKRNPRRTEERRGRTMEGEREWKPRDLLLPNYKFGRTQEGNIIFYPLYPRILLLFKVLPRLINSRSRGLVLIGPNI